MKNRLEETVFSLCQRLLSMNVKEIIKKEVITTTADTPLLEAIRLMFRSRVSGLPVIGPRLRLLGMLSEKDAFAALHPSYQEYYESPESYTDFKKMEDEGIKRVRSLKVRDAMSKELTVAHINTPILKIGALMLAKKIHRVPVIEKRNKLIGIVTRRDIYRAIFRHAFDL